jgi:hypothetical protein
MSGAKTRFGFAGDGSEPPDSDEARGARTIIGRDIHLPLRPGLASGGNPASDPYPAARVPPTPTPQAPASRSAIPSYLTEEPTAELPSRRPRAQGKSRLARFLGRWTDSGRFVSEGRGPGAGGYDNLETPRDPLARNVVLVLVVALVTFVLTLLGVKARQHFASKASPASAPAGATTSTAGPKPAPPER